MSGLRCCFPFVLWRDCFFSDFLVLTEVLGVSFPFFFGRRPLFVVLAFPPPFM